MIRPQKPLPFYFYIPLYHPISTLITYQLKDIEIEILVRFFPNTGIP